MTIKDYIDVQDEGEDEGEGEEAEKEVADEPRQDTTGVYSCAIIGIVLMGIGAYFLVNPGVTVDTSGLSALGVASETSIVNLQKLVVGQTCAIMGAIFFAMAIRPR